jgi:hypothetical protein
MVENRGDGGQRQCGRQPRQAGVELMDGSAERVTGDVERHGDQGHGGNDALDLEAEGLVGGDLQIHGGGGEGVGDRSSPVADPSLVQGGESGARYPACGVTPT